MGSMELKTLLKGCLRKYQYAQTYYIHYAHTRASFTVAITHDLPVSIISCTSVDAKHHGASLSERWNVTCMGG